MSETREEFAKRGPVAPEFPPLRRFACTVAFDGYSVMLEAVTIRELLALRRAYLAEHGIKPLDIDAPSVSGAVK